ncbi:MAG: tRNA threonylcarbamoyladenosine dehydratase [Bacteroidetes bacterium]|nr:tRNA threonylcarbamoyladenosine dehydratase [Bacteroidota bacterium]
MDETLWYARTALLLGNENIEKLRQSHVLVVGLGGVGAYAAEQLGRAGIGAMTIVDGDTVHPSNRNRQLAALISNEGKAKTEIIAGRLKDINPEIKLTVIQEYLKEQALFDVVNAVKYDYVVDAIDTLSPKLYLIYHSLNAGLRLVSSMGSGGKLDPSKVHVADISQTHICPLADMLRKKLHKLNVYTGFKTVFSTERIPKHVMVLNENEPNKKSTVGTISYMPPIFGCLMAAVVIREILGEKIESDLHVPHSVRRKVKHQATGF